MSETHAQLLDARQEQYLNWLLTPPADRQPTSQQKYCELHGIDPTTVRRWQKKPHFIKEWERRVADINGSPERTQRLYDAIYDKALEGDIRAAKLYLEATHRLMPAPSASASASKSMNELTDGELDELIAKMAEREKAQRQLKVI